MSNFSRMAAALLVVVAASACTTDDQPSIASGIAGPSKQVQLNGFTAPSTLVTVAGDREVWPYTSTGFSTTPQDPINLVFTGAASDPRQIRATLLGLSG